MQPALRWWFPVPFAVMQSTEARVLPIGAVEVFLAVVAEGHKRGSSLVPYVNHHDGHGTIGSIVMREGHARGGESVRPLVQALVDLGWLALDDDARCIRITRDAALDGSSAEPLAAVGPVAHPSTPSSPRPSPSDTSKPVASDAAPRGARRSKTLAQVKSSIRSARWYFDRRFDPTVKRRRPYSYVPVGVTWEQWCASEEGRGWLDEIGATEHGDDLGARGRRSKSSSTTEASVAGSVAVVGDVADVDAGNVAESVASNGNGNNGNASTVAEGVAGNVASVAESVAGNVAEALPTLATPLPSHTLPSEREEKKRNQTPRERVSAPEGGNAGNGNAGNGNAGNGNAHRESTSTTTPTNWRQSNAPISGIEFRSLCAERLDKSRVRPPSLALIDTFELSIERTSLEWSRLHEREVTRADWLDFIEWLRVGGAQGEGGLWFPTRNSPADLSRGARDQKWLHEQFEKAMDWRDEKRARDEAEAKARAAQKQQVAAFTENAPKLTPEQIRAARHAAGLPPMRRTNGDQG